MLLPFDIEACRSYVYYDMGSTLAEYDVVQYKSMLGIFDRSILDPGIIGICLQIGCVDHNPKFEELAKKLLKEIDTITTDKSENNKLFNFAKRIIQLGKHYLMLSRR